MLNPRLAARYAKSLMDISIEQNKLDAIYNDMVGLKSVFSESRDFVMLMKSPIVKADAKYAVVKSITTGKIFANISKENKNDSFSISTPTLVAGVRGTSFLIDIKKDEFF